jgi:hypothetical protein
MPRTCLYCKLPIKGRADKKFCDANCRGAYHNNSKAQGRQLIKRINQQLLQNYGALKVCFNQANSIVEPVISKQKLRDWNFDPNFHTSRKIIAGKVYYFTYDIGYTVLNTDEVALKALPQDYGNLPDIDPVEEPTTEYGF